MNSEKYIGLDVHQATISVAVMGSTLQRPASPIPAGYDNHLHSCSARQRLHHDAGTTYDLVIGTRRKNPQSSRSQLGWVAQTRMRDRLVSRTEA